MLTIESLIAVLSFGLACFELGYTLGNKNTKKIIAPSPQNLGDYFNQIVQD